MFPCSWLIIFLISILAFVFINSSWSSFFSSPLNVKEDEEPMIMMKEDLWF
uniref:ATP synthase F0 subunit 8 n=1 Tax=Brueelia nebulosa TaxID=2972756 RepID=UPI0023AB2482|nr:ATP synthase F0 subunit 8 [Brueelia nebulosa]WCF77119.1 ATP synthase F0 subunit 8 [Brueelia nebulosa]